MFSYFYHQRLRKTVATFGSLFNNIYVLRKDAAGDVISQVKVPLAYAPKEKYLERIRENPDLDNDTKVAIKLPRMSFEITSLQYDAERKLPKTNNFRRTASNTEATKFFSPTPYLVSFQLNVYSKTQDDALQIVEQIIPYFNPQYTLSIKPFSDHSDVIEDVPITIQAVTFTDDFEGTVEQRRTIIYSLEFEMRINFYGPISDKGLITDAITELYLMGDSDSKAETITVTTDPSDVSPDSDYGFNIDIETYYE
jgi:hypothetical protein